MVELDEEDLGICSGCGRLSVIVTSRPLPPDLVGRGAGPMKAFLRLCASCAPDPSRRTPRSSRSTRYLSTTPVDPWWSK